MIYAVAGGLGTVTGPIVGAVVMVWLDELIWRQFPRLNLLILGAGDGAAGAVPAARHRRHAAAQAPAMAALHPLKADARMEILVLNGIVNGLIVGGIYALIGMSLTLLYGVLRIVNFAHGEFVIGGSFLAYALFSRLGLPPLYALPVAAVSFFALGWAAYYLLLPRLRSSDDPESMSFLMMYGMSIALAAVMLLIFEADSRSIDYAFSPISMKVGPIYVSTARIVAFGDQPGAGRRADVRSCSAPCRARRCARRS